MMAGEEQIIATGQVTIQIMIAVGISVLAAGVIGLFKFISNTNKEIEVLKIQDETRSRCITRIEKKIDISTRMQEKLADTTAKVGQTVAVQGSMIASHLKDSDEAMNKFDELHSTVVELKTDMGKLSALYDLTKEDDH